jgi:UDP-2-acetamido-2-deoxy-ribo-hexuluronate aminotransferase
MFHLKLIMFITYTLLKLPKEKNLHHFLLKNDIQTGIHYPIPPHLQKAYSDLGYKKGDFPIAESMSKTCLSLPLYPGLTFEEVDTVCDQIKNSLNDTLLLYSF